MQAGSALFFLPLRSEGNLLPVIVRGLMGAGFLLLSRVGLFSGEADFFWSDCQSGVRFLWGFIGTGLAGNEKSCTFALAKPRGVRS